MFDLRLKPNVTITHRNGALYVRPVPRSKAKTILALLPSTIIVGLFGFLILWKAIRTASNVVHILPILGLILVVYGVVLRLTLGPISTLDEIAVDRGVLSWSRRILRWTRTMQIPGAEITEIKAVTPWLNRQGACVELIAEKRRHVIAQ